MKPTPPEKYLEEAHDKGMTVAGPIPESTLVKLKWKCNSCGRVYDRSLKEMRRIPHCKCHGLNAITEKLYQALADALGISWIGNTLPMHTRDNTLWRGNDGIVFEAPYAQLSRPSIPRRYRGHLSPDCEPSTNNYTVAPHVERLREMKRGH